MLSQKDRREASRKREDERSNTAQGKVAKDAAAIQARTNELLAKEKAHINAKDLDAANAIAVRGMRDAAKASVTETTTGIARLAQAWSSIPFYLVQSGNAPLDETLAARVTSHLRAIAAEHKAIAEDKETVNGKVVTVGQSVATLFDSVGRVKAGAAAIGACLLAFREMTQARIAYLGEKKMPFPSDLPNYEWQVGKPNQGSYFEGLCFPHNLLRPVKPIGVDKKALKRIVNGKEETFYKPELELPNKDASPRHANETQLRALFAHFFSHGAKKLTYDTTSRTADKVPSGWLVAMPTLPRTTSAQNKPGTVRVDVALRKLGNTTTGALVAEASKLRDFMPKQWGMSAEESPLDIIAASCRLAREAICAARKHYSESKAFAEGVAGSELALLFDTVRECVAEPRKDEYRLVGLDGKPTMLLSTDKQIMPDPKGSDETKPVATTLRKRARTSTATPKPEGESAAAD